MTNQGNGDKDEVYRGRLEALVLVTTRQSDLLKKVDKGFNREFHMEHVAKLAAEAHGDKRRISDLEVYSKTLNERVDSIVTANPILLSDPLITADYQDIKNAGLLYREFTL